MKGTSVLLVFVALVGCQATSDDRKSAVSSGPQPVAAAAQTGTQTQAWLIAHPNCVGRWDFDASHSGRFTLRFRQAGSGLAANFDAEGYDKGEASGLRVGNGELTMTLGQFKGQVQLKLNPVTGRLAGSANRSTFDSVCAASG